MIFIKTLTRFVVRLTVAPFVAYFVIIIHLYIHGVVLYLFNKLTSKQKVPFSRNPLMWQDPKGLIYRILSRFFSKPPKIGNPYYSNYPRLFPIIVGLAGPLLTLLTIYPSFILIFMLFNISRQWQHPLGFLLGQIILYFGELFIYISICVGLITLFFSGTHILKALIPKKFEQKYYTYEPGVLLLLSILLSLIFLTNSSTDLWRQYSTVIDYFMWLICRLLQIC